MKLTAAIIIAAFTAVPLAPAMAQTATAPAAKSTSTSTATTTATTAAKPAKPTAQRTAKSLDCSKQADAKKVHGKERRSFMDKCKRS